MTFWGQLEDQIVKEVDRILTPFCEKGPLVVWKKLWAPQNHVFNTQIYRIRKKKHKHIKYNCKKIFLIEI